MDKRTILFVLALAGAMFLVNTYFDYQRTESKTQWSEQQKAKKIDTLNKLREEIAGHTVQASSLPLVEVYADANFKDFLSTGIEVGDAVLILAKTKEMPSKIFMKGNKEISLIGMIQDSAAVYGTPGTTLKIGDLPDFGKYDLQLVIPEHPPQVLLGDYTDGRLSLPIEKMGQLSKELEISSPALPSFQNAIALLKTVNGYLPVGLYNQQTKTLDPFAAISGLTSKPQQKNAVTSNQKSEEKFFVLETPYQQLVFSNYGAALIEINLPFQSESDKLSVVKEIEFDRDMVEKHPYNAHFPAHPYYTPGFTLHNEGVLGGYYPLLRRDLIESVQKKSIRIPPRYYALNIVSEYPETAEMVYEVKQFDKNQIVFEAVQQHRRITKTYTVNQETEGAPYVIDLTIKIDGDARGLWLTSGIPEVEWISGAPASTLKYRITRNQKAEVNLIELPKNSITVSSVYPDWLCNSNGFLGMILDPLSEIDPGYRAQYVSGTVAPSRLVEIDSEYQRFKAQDLPGYMVLLPLKGSGGTMKFRVFAGPFADGILKTVDKTYTNAATGYNPDYIASQTFHGWFAFISEPFAKFLFILMNFFHSLTGSWAFSIILLTVALRLMLYPLNAWSTKSMLRMQQIAPEVAAIQEKYKKDPKKGQLEIMNLYRDRGVNPVSGCFPLLIQMPFLVGMFDLLKSTFELRGASFIPGWIDDLTAPDVLFSWNTPIFFIGTQFHLLPFLLGAVMYIQQKLMSTLPKDPSLLTEQQRQQKFMGNIMTVVFTVMFYNFPSGLNIYWLSSMILGILQQLWTTKKMQANPLPLKGKEKKA